MERLPRETFLQIASFLDFETRFQFACVCKTWYTIVSNYNLYETVYIDKDHQAPINFFLNHKELGVTVRSLQVNGIGITFSHIKQWPQYFPNLLNFSLVTAEIDMFSSDYEEDEQEEEEEEEEGDEEFYEQEGYFNQTSESFQRWQRLESLSEFTKHVYTGSILLSGHFPNLTTIDLNFNLVPEESSDSVMDHLLMGLKNAPCLKYFKLIVAKLTLNKLDLLHHNAPSIEALILEDIALGEDTLTTTEFIPQSVNQLKRLEMQGSRYSFYESEDISISDWLSYIAQKYPQIEVLKMNQFTPASIEYESNIIEIVQHCKQLKTCNVDVCHLSAKVLQAFDQTSIQLEKYSSQSQDLTELRNLSLSKQRHSIYRVDLVIPVGNTDLVEILGQFTGLTTINTYPSTDIDYAVGKPLQVPINTFLKQHSKLEFLSLSSCVLYIDQDQEDQEIEKIQSVLDTLEMEKVTIQNQSVFDFISYACPVVKVIILTARLIELNLTTKLNFEKNLLVYLKVYIEGHDVIELNQQGKKKEWYQLQKEEEKKIKYIQQQRQKIIGTHTLLIEVNHVERIVFNLPRNPFVLL